MRDVRPLDPPRRLLMGSGPSNPSPRVLRALATAPPPPNDAALGALLGDLRGSLQRVFRAEHATTLAVAGASRAGIEAALASLLEPGDRVLVGVYGHFGELLCTLAARHGACVERVDATWGAMVDPDALVAALRQQRSPPRAVAIVHADTSTGIRQPLAEIGRACQEVGTVLLVDTVLSIGGCPVEVDAWGIDAAIGGMQKCLGGPPGLAPLVYSSRFGEELARRTSVCESAYLDLRQLETWWREPRVGGFTPMLLALREALRVIDEEGLEPRWQRHEATSQALRAGLLAMGLELFGDMQHSVPMITLVRVPPGISEAAVRAQLLAEHDVEIMAAFGPLRGQVWRIGTMGINANLPPVLQVLSALETVLSHQGFKLSRGAAADAATQAWNLRPARAVS